MKVKNILVLENCSEQSSGTEISLFQLLIKLLEENKYYIILTTNSKNNCYNVNKENAIRLPFVWFRFSLNPIYLFKCIYSIFISTFKLINIIKKHRIELVYSNSTKAHIYSSILKLFSGIKVVWHIRDNIKKGIFNNFLVKYCDKIICISEYIYNQVNAPIEKKHLIYCGIDINSWLQNKDDIQNDIRKELKLPKTKKLIAQISQLTPWKNHPDFIMTAKIISQENKDVHFLIIGDDISGNEKKYVKQIKNQVKAEGLDKCLTFLGFRSDIKNTMNQIDILIHPAINEPFGRVLIEAMALEKSVVAYNCGGAKEIIINKVTGYLVKPYDYQNLAEKTKRLINNDESRIKFGKAGRKRVIDNFNIVRYIKDIDKVFSTV